MSTSGCPGTPCVGVVGATGLVGETIVRVLAERNIPIAELRPFASRAHETAIGFRGRALPVMAVHAAALRGCDVVFFASGDDGAARWAPVCLDAGAVVIDNSATYRLRDDVPLIVPEINADAVSESQRLFAVANCTAIIVAMALAPIARYAGLHSVRIASYQAASGAGRAGLDELEASERAIQSGSHEAAARVFPAQIARNVVPQIGAIDDDGPSGEERKIAVETRKILALPALHVAVTAVRVPVWTAHSAALYVETERSTSVDDLAERFEAAQGIVFHRRGIITPRDVEGGDDVHVARVRAEDDSGNRFALWVVGDQLRKGAATTAVQIFELLLRHGIVARRPVHA